MPNSVGPRTILGRDLEASNEQEVVPETAGVETVDPTASKARSLSRALRAAATRCGAGILAVGRRARRQRQPSRRKARLEVGQDVPPSGADPLLFLPASRVDLAGLARAASNQGPPPSRALPERGQPERGASASAELPRSCPCERQRPIASHSAPKISAHSAIGRPCALKSNACAPKSARGALRPRATTAPTRLFLHRSTASRTSSSNLPQNLCPDT